MPADDFRPGHRSTHDRRLPGDPLSPIPPNTRTFAIYGPIARDDLPGLSARVCALLNSKPRPDAWICDTTSVEPDAVTVDALARLQLGARRNGTRIHLNNASRELTALIAAMGLADVLTPPAAAAARTAGTGAPSTGRT